MIKLLHESQDALIVFRDDVIIGSLRKDVNIIDMCDRSYWGAWYDSKRWRSYRQRKWRCNVRQPKAKPMPYRVRIIRWQFENFGNRRVAFFKNPAECQTFLSAS